MPAGPCYVSTKVLFYLPKLQIEAFITINDVILTILYPFLGCPVPCGLKVGQAGFTLCPPNCIP